MNATTRLVPSYVACRWLLIPAVALHNTEEWITEPRYGSISPTLQDHVLGFLPLPSLRVMQVGWIIVTVVPALVVISAASAGRSRIRNWLVCWVTSMYLANAFLPHLLEFAMTRSYAPGVVTAVFVSVPFAIVLLRRALVEEYLSGPQLFAAVSAGFVGQPLVLAAVDAIASAIAAVLYSAT
jgi:hypothetical protein